MSDVSASTLEGIHSRIGSGSIPVFYKGNTEPLFYFHYLLEDDTGSIRERALRCYSAFEPGNVDVKGFSTTHATAFVYDSDFCNEDRPGIWVQLSPIVEPSEGVFGLFVRTTRVPCSPIGGSRYWAPIKSLEDPVVTDLVNLGVLEF